MRIGTKIKWFLTGAAAVTAGLVVTGYAILATMDFDDLRAAIEAEAKAATGRTLSIAGPVDLRVSLTPAIAIENVSFGNASWGTWPELLSIRRLEVEVRLLPLLTGEIEVRRLMLIEPTILLETSADGHGNWVVDGADAPAAEAPADPTAIPAFHRIDVRGGNLLFRDGATGDETKVALTRLEAVAETPASPSEISLAAVYNGVAVEASGTLGSRDAFLSGAPFPLDLRVGAANATFKLAGEIAEPAAARGLDLHLEVRGERLADLNALVGQELPALGPYQLAARVGDAPAGYKLTGVAAVLGASDLAGNATVALDGARPRIAGTLHSTNLDVNDFEEPGQAAAGPTGNDGTGKRLLLSDEPLPLDALSAIDGRIKLTADQMRLDDRTVLSGVSMTLDLDAGRLRASDLVAGFSGGQVSGTLSFDAAAERPPITLDLAVKGFDYGHFLQGRDVTEGVSGTLDATVRLAGAGASLRAWASSLDGRIDLAGGEGRVRSDLLQATGAGLINMVSAWREADNDLRLNCVVMRLPVKGGVLGTEAVLIDTAAVTVGIAGTVDLRDETLDLKVTPQAKHASLMSLAVPLRVGGTLAEPGVGPDPIGTAMGAAKIAGMFLNPLIAGAAIILDSEMSAKNPCVAALEKTRAPAEPDKQAAPSAAERAIEGAGGALKDAGEGVSRGLRNLFND